MIVRAIDANNDWLFGKGRNDYKKDLLATSQNIKTRLQSFLGDCFFDREAGIDWFSRLGGKSTLAIKLDVSSVILNTADVSGLIELSVNVDNNRNITIQYSASTVYGDVSDNLTAGV